MSVRIYGRLPSWSPVRVLFYWLKKTSNWFLLVLGAWEPSIKNQMWHAFSSCDGKGLNAINKFIHFCMYQGMLTCSRRSWWASPTTFVMSTSLRTILCTRSAAMVTWEKTERSPGLIKIPSYYFKTYIFDNGYN